MPSARDLHRAWPELDARVVPDAGHSAFEPGNARELVRATDAFAKRQCDAWHAIASQGGSRG
jgi:hypothetical protein